MKKIVFEFYGGSLDGQTLAGGANRSLSAVQCDPILKSWFATHRGTRGEVFCAAPESAATHDHWYEVTDCIEGEEQCVVQARHVPDPTN